MNKLFAVALAVVLAWATVMGALADPYSTQTVEQQKLFGDQGLSVVDIDGYKYASTQTSYDAYFKEVSNHGDGLRYCDDVNGTEHCITYQPQDMSYRDANGAQDYISSIQGVSVVLDEFASVNGSEVLYPGVFPNTTLVYDLQDSILKEYFVLDEYPGAPASSLGSNVTLDYGGYIKFPTTDMYVGGVEQTGDFVTSESIDFRAPGGEVVWYLPEPVAIDANGAQTVLQYEVDVRSNQIWFYVRTPADWLANATYPVKIDPSVQDAQIPTDNVTQVGFERNGWRIDARLYRHDNESLIPINDVWVNNTAHKFGGYDADNTGSELYKYVFESPFPGKLHKQEGEWYFGPYQVNLNDICNPEKSPTPNCEYTAAQRQENATLYYQLQVDFTSDADIDPSYSEVDGDEVVTFTSSGTFNLESIKDVEYLVVAGGGGGGGYRVQGSDGADSAFHTVTSTGGGGGGGRNGGDEDGRAGGSGGGAGAGTGSTSGGSGVSGQGSGGGSASNDYGGAGGGGAGAAGSNNAGSEGAPGGSGSQSSITGTSTYYAGGGGGGARPSFKGGCGGLGGGASGADDVAGCTGSGLDGSAVANTGGGGGGASGDSEDRYGAGGGGAGGMLTGTLTSLSPGNYSVTVGSGGAAGGEDATQGADGVVILRYSGNAAPTIGSDELHDASGNNITDLSAVYEFNNSLHFALTNVSDEDGDQVNVTFLVDKGAAVALNETFSSVSGDLNSSSFQLDQYGVWNYTITASDGSADTIESGTINVTNYAPVVGEIDLYDDQDNLENTSNVSGEVLDDLYLQLVNVTDGDGDAVSVTYLVDNSSGHVALNTTVSSVSTNTTSPAFDVPSIGSWDYLVTASDGTDDQVYAGSFTVTNAAPNITAVSATPDGGSGSCEASAACVAQFTMSEDGCSLSSQAEQIKVLTEAGSTVLDDTNLDLSSETEPNTCVFKSNAFTPSSTGTYTVQASYTDGSGVASSLNGTFTVVENDGDSSAGGGSGGGGSTGSGSEVLAGFELVRPQSGMVERPFCSQGGVAEPIPFEVDNPYSTGATLSVEFAGNLSCDPVQDIEVEGQSAASFELTNCGCPGSADEQINGSIKIIDSRDADAFIRVPVTLKGSTLDTFSLAVVVGGALVAGLALVGLLAFVGRRYTA